VRREAHGIEQEALEEFAKVLGGRALEALGNTVGDKNHQIYWKK
jgi:hypothetical protein